MNLFDILISLLRKSPALILVISILLFIITELDIYMLLAIWIMIGDILNNILKQHIFKPLMGSKRYSIFGYGTRPKNSKNPALFGDINCPPYKGSYGMPSGHSQSALTFAIFIILIINNFHKSLSPVLQYFTIGSVILFALMVLWSRIYLNCHTIQQVIAGSIIGIIWGYYGYLLYLKL